MTNPHSVVASQVNGIHGGQYGNLSEAKSSVSTTGLQAPCDPELLNSQKGREFLSIQRRHVIDLMRECYQLQEGEEISGALRTIIESLVEKVVAHLEGDEDQVRSSIVEMIKSSEPLTAHTLTRSSSSPGLPSSSKADVTHSPSSTAVKPAAPGDAPKPATAFTTKDLLKALNEVGQDEGNQLVGQLEDLRKARPEAALTWNINKTKARINAFSDLDDCEKELKAAEKGIDFLAGLALEQKKGLVDNLRKTEFDNRMADKSFALIEALRSGTQSPSETPKPIDAETCAQKWLQSYRKNEANRRAKRETATPGQDKLKAQVAESLKKTVNLMLGFKVELNAARIEALEVRMKDLEPVEKARLEGLQQRQAAAEREGNVDELRNLTLQADQIEIKINNLKEQREKISELREKVTAAGVDLRAIQALHEQLNAKNQKANALPFSLHMLGNGVKSGSVEEGFGLNPALEYGRSGKSNSAMPRSMALRIHLAEFGSDFSIYKNEKSPATNSVRGDRRSFLSELSGGLGAEGGRPADKALVLDFLSTKKGREYIHRLAACNVTAAGFNAKTLKLDAPSLAYKVESGFSAFKKLMMGRVGVYARDPMEHVGKRLEALSRLSTVLQMELFRDGKPVCLDHALITPEHAVEASSLLLAALPNDLLTTGHVAVTEFMKSVKEFESEILSANKEDRPVDLQKHDEFKKVVNAFHETAAKWVRAREKLGAAPSVDAAKQISAEIAAIGRKGLFRRTVTSLGNFINLTGGKGIREGLSSMKNYLSQVNQKERLRQQFQRPENVARVADLKRGLNSLVASSGNESDVRNAEALKQYLSGKTLAVELQGDLSPRLKENLAAISQFLHAAWEPVGKGKPLPKVINLTYVPTNSIPNKEKSSSDRLAMNPSVHDSVKSKVVHTRPMLKTTSMSSVAAVADMSDDAWIVGLWRNQLDESSNNSEKLDAIFKEYNRIFRSKNPGDTVSNEAEKAYQQNCTSLFKIAKYCREGEEIPGEISVEMKKLLPILFEIKRGEALEKLLTVDERKLQDVSSDKQRCWLRSAWGAAVKALPQNEFIRRINAIATPMSGVSDNKKFNPGEINTIYQQIMLDSSSGLSQSAALENKQRALMIALMDEAPDGWKVGTTRQTLLELKDGKDPQVEGDFAAVFFNALDLPLIIHREGSIPDCYLPDNYDVDAHGHPDTWPTLRYDGTGNTGHWRFYEKPANA